MNPARIAGDVQFDSSERWEVGNALGGAAFDLVYTAVHEIGHALGLDHSNVAGSVMARTISPNQSSPAWRRPTWTRSLLCMPPIISTTGRTGGMRKAP